MTPSVPSPLGAPLGQSGLIDLRQYQELIARIEAVEKQVGPWEKVESLGAHTANSVVEVRRFFGMLQFRGTCTMKNEVAPIFTVLFTMPASVRPVSGRLSWANDASTGFVGGIGYEVNGNVVWRGGEIPTGGVVFSFEGTFTTV